MDDRERSGSLEEAVLAAVRGIMAGTWTAMPGIIQAFDIDEQTATVQGSIQSEVTAQDGSKSLATLPLLIHCPVQFPEGGECVITFPVKKDDECLVVFASRAIDAWWQSGGVQPQVELRMHDLSDGFVLLGFRSLPNMTPSVSTTALEVRSKDGATFLALDPTAQTINLTAPGGSTIDAMVTINGGLTVNGPIVGSEDITAGGDIVTDAGDVKAGNITLKTHRTPGITAGAAIAPAPVP